jgi:hypothetical protein
MSLPLSNIEIMIAGSRSGKCDRAGLSPFLKAHPNAKTELHLGLR